MFGSKTVRVEYWAVDGDGTLIGYDELNAKKIPLDFDFPTEVEIDGKRYAVKSAEPGTRKRAVREGLLKVKVEALLQESPVSPEEEAEQTVLESVVLPADVQTVVEVEQVTQENGFHEASCAASPPRMTGKRTDYHWVDLKPWLWRQVEFIRRDLGPEIGEELSGIQGVMDKSRIEVQGQPRFSNQFVRELTQLPFRGASFSDVSIQSTHFPFGTRKDGVGFTGIEGYVDSGFAYVLPSGLALYGQEFDNRVTCMGLTVSGDLHPAYLDEDVQAVGAMMQALDLVLVDWSVLEAVEPNEKELRDYLERYFV